MINNLIQLFEYSIQSNHGIHYISGDNNTNYMTYKEMYDIALGILYILQNNGIKSNDKAIILLDNNESFICNFWACILGGIIPVPVTVGNSIEHKLKIFKIWKILNNGYLLTDKKNLLILEKYANENSCYKDIINSIRDKTLLIDDIKEIINQGKVYQSKPDDIAFLQFSSGSTGDPKGVTLTHLNLITNIYAIKNGMKLESNDTCLSWMPLTHDMGLIGFHLTPMMEKIHQYIMPTSLFIRRPLLWMKKASEHKISVLSSPNFGYKYFLDHYNDERNENWDFSNVRLIFNGAEPISAYLCNKFLSKLEKYKLKNDVMFPVYGLAEASLAVSFPPLKEKIKLINLSRKNLNTGTMIKEVKEDDESVTFIDLGYPVSDCKIRICDDKENILQENTIGNIHISGKNVTKGYYNNPIATKKIITKDGWLNTGDLGFIRNGRLTITGRAKDIIFINGQNFYPQDIERIAESIGIYELGEIIACGIFDKALQKEILLIFILNKKSINEFIESSVSLKNVINKNTGLDVCNIIPIKKIPKTTSGKIQRYKLLELYNDGEFNDIIKEVNELTKIYLKDKIVELPGNKIEEKLSVIIKNILGLNSISVTDNFFEIGMDSLKAADISSNIKKEFNVEISISDIFENLNIKNLAVYISGKEKMNFKNIEKLKEKDYYELSSSQKRIFILNQIETESTVYNISSVLLIKGNIDYEKFENTFNKLLQRHESLRTSFKIINGDPVQVINNQIEFKIVYLKKTEKFNDGDIIDFIRPFDLTKAPLLRVGLIEISTEEHLLIFDIHHIIADGSSAMILAREFVDLYNDKTLPPLNIQYKEFSIWHNAQLKDEKINEQKCFWMNEFKDNIPVLNLNYDFIRPTFQSFEGKKIIFQIDKMLANNIKKIAIDNETSLYTILLSTFYILLSKYSGQDDIIIGTPVAGRNHPDLINIIGMFVNTLAIRNFPVSSKTFKTFLLEVKDKTLKTFENQLYQYEMLIDDLNIKRNMGRNPLFDVMFVLQNMGEFNMDKSGLKFLPYNFDYSNAKFDLTLFAKETNGTIEFEFEFSTSLFTKNTIEKMKDHYVNLLNVIAINQGIKIAEIDILTSEEKEFLISSFNKTNSPYPTKNIIDLFEEQVDKSPNAIAIEFEGKEITYNELNIKSNQLCCSLKEKGIKPGCIVGIMASNSPEMIFAILGVLKTGGAYLPLDPTYPEDRIFFMIEDSKTDVFLIQKKYENKINSIGNLIFIDDDRSYKGSARNPEKKAGINDLVYIIYTSGSTGKPKGVMLENKGLTNYIWWAKKKYINNTSESFPLYSSLSFDLTVTSIFTPLINGNRMVIYPEKEDEFVLYRIMRETKTSIVKLTPSHLSLIKDLDNRNSTIKKFIVGGEDLKTELAKAITSSFNGKIEIFNEYGPTETVVGCMIHKYDMEKDIRKSVPIGIPADNVSIYILDANLKPVPVGTIGEMYISGDGVARGYLNREELTSKSFVKNPFVNDMRMYKTGDLARFLNTGIIEYVGRCDQQVKINGYRIEINEIENQLLKYEKINDAVIIDYNINKNKILCAYFVSEIDITEKKLKDYLLKFLPEYMIPKYFVRIDKIPLTINGKVDRTLLPLPIYNENLAKEFIKPLDNREEYLVKTIAVLMNLDEVSMNENFFYIGGDSIKAIQISNKLREMGYKLKVKDILSNPDIKEMSKFMEKITDNIIDQKPCEGYIELTPIVSWFFSRKLENYNHYNQSVLLDFKQDIYPDELQIILKELYHHHDSLRINYDKMKNRLFYNNLHNNDSIECKEYDLSLYDQNEQYKQIENIGTQLKSSFKIENDLLIKACIFKTSDNSKKVLLTAHHLVVDGFSWRIILEDFFTLFNQIKQNTKTNLRLKTNSYQEWANFINNKKDDVASEQIQYWENITGDIHSNIQPDFFNEKILPGNNDVIKLELDKEITKNLIYHSYNSYGTETKDLLITALVLTFCNYIKKDEITIELEGHGREQLSDNIDVSRTTGWFTSIFPVSFNVKNTELHDAIINVKEQLRNIKLNGIGFGIIKYLSGKINDNNRRYIRFNYLGDFKNNNINSLFDISLINSGKESSDNNVMTALIDINLILENDILHIFFNYSKNDFREETVKKLAKKYKDTLQTIIDHCVNKKTREFSPSDFDMVKLSKEDIDSLLV